jgi:DNA polymerase-3 subunit epsilon
VSGTLLLRLLGPARARARLARLAGDNALGRYYAQPLPSPVTPLRDARFGALDFETTGFDARTGAILSYGFVAMQGLDIELASARSAVVSPGLDLPPETVAIHRLTDDRVATGLPEREALDEILQCLSGRVLVAHHASIELSFLDAACRRCYGLPFMSPVVDTEREGSRWFSRRGRTPPPAGLRLSSLRDTFGLPRYRAHDALTDALATAELLAALISHRGAETAPLRTCLN